jgi:hypothetical protein
MFGLSAPENVALSKDLTLEDVIEHLKKYVELAGSQKAFCDRHDMAYAFVSRVINGKDKPSPDLLRAIGLERVTIYRRVA